ncbi:hypothetical protein [Nocardiopsis sp. CC223A]|uniref:hypothetical protein n=1 Tax=Nocardiopsis sp. CC223A TaxID=3044051 RepID=UPI00278C0A2F|nr:hypothetical protein [Nocardiopsis sp. CC223A]
MSGHEVGVNARDAYQSGNTAESYAADFIGLGEDFKAVLDAAKSACDHEPEVTGWEAYGEEQAEAIAKVEEHGLSLAENVQAGAAEASHTDVDSGDGFSEAGSPLGRPINFY